LLSSDWLLPAIFQREGVAQIVCDLVFQLRLRHHRIERRLGSRILLWPNPVTPVNVFDRSLKRDALGEAERSGLTRSLPRRVIGASRSFESVPSVGRIRR